MKFALDPFARYYESRANLILLNDSTLTYEHLSIR
jgi:hypothetical protein